MAELAKKLHFLKNGTEQTAKAYSTTGEAGSSYIPSKIDGVACYIPIGSTSDVMATNGRVIKGGTTYAIKSQSKPAYAEKSWTTPGTYTWSAPAGVTRVRVACCGGGGGGVPDTTDTRTAGSGGTSKFGNLISATGGTGARQTGSYEDTENWSSSSQPGTGGTPNGRNGKRGGTGTGGTGFALSFSLANGSYGNGGTWNSGGIGSGGGSGGYNTGYVNVTSGSTYSIVVGEGGHGLDAYGKYTCYGNSGFVYIAYGGDI